MNIEIIADDLSDKEIVKLHNLVRENPLVKDLVKPVSEIQDKSVFLSGPITGVDGYKGKFADAAEVIKALGASSVFNPAAEIPDVWKCKVRNGYIPLHPVLRALTCRAYESRYKLQIEKR